MAPRIPGCDHNRAYWLLLLLWPLVVLPLTYIAAAMLEGALQDPRLIDNHASLPLLTQWYRLVGTTGMYLISALPALLALILLPLRGRLFAVAALALALVASIYVSFGGMVAVNIAYVKLCL